MTDEKRRLVKEYLEGNAELAVEIAREINRYDGSCDWADTYYIEDIATWTEPTELARAIIYGNVTCINEMVRYDAYSNLETVYEFDLECDAIDYLDDIIDGIDRLGDNIFIDDITLNMIIDEEENEEEEE